jgi:hypothetical protein
MEDERMAKENLKKFITNVVEKDQKLKQKIRAKANDQESWGEWVSAEGAKHGYDFSPEEAVELVFGPKELSGKQLAQAHGARAAIKPVGKAAPGAPSVNPGGKCNMFEYGDCCKDV